MRNAWEAAAAGAGPAGRRASRAGLGLSSAPSRRLDQSANTYSVPPRGTSLVIVAIGPPQIGLAPP